MGLLLQLIVISLVASLGEPLQSYPRTPIRRFSLRPLSAVADCYATLGISETASDAEIKRAYRRAATKLHPDVNKEPDAATRFSEACEAYETLKDPAVR